MVLLISAVYVCEHRHKRLAHDQCILDRFPSSCMIPFILLARSGFTTSCMNTLELLCQQGMNFMKVETLLIERRLLAYKRQEDILTIHKELTKQPVCKGDFWKSPLSKCPSNDLISKIFLAGFLKTEHVYVQEMMTIPTEISISFDHTFQVATNIGFLREDTVWVPQYNSLFLVMNEKGHVVTWQLTKGTSFSAIETLLSDLKERSPILKTMIAANSDRSSPPCLEKEFL